MEDLSKKSKDELIAEINFLRRRIEDSNILFPGLGVINKFERLNNKTIEKYRLLFQKFVGASLIIRKNVIVECNEKAEQIIEQPKEKIVGNPLWDFCPINQPDGSNSKKLIQQTFKKVIKQSPLKLETTLLLHNIEPLGVNLYFSKFTIDDELHYYIEIEKQPTNSSISESEKNLETSNKKEEVLGGFWEYNRESKELFWSPSLYALHDVPQNNKPPNLEEYLNDFVFPEDHQNFLNIVAQSINQNQEYEVDFRIYTKKNRFKHLQIKNKIIYKADGSVEKVIGTITDITQRKELENKIKESKEIYGNLVENLPEGIVIYTLNKILFANSSAYRISEVAKERKEDTEIKYTIFDFILPEFKEEVRRKIKLIYKGKSLGNVEMKIKTSAGKILNIDARSSLIDFKGQKAIQVIFNDITYKKQVEKSLKESERRLSTLIGNLQGMAYRCKNDKDWTFEFVSDGCFEVTGYTPTEILEQQTVKYNDLILEEDAALIDNEIKKSILENKNYIIQYRIKTKDGYIKWLSEQGKGIYNEHNELIAYEGFIIDISKRKSAELALQNFNENYKNLIDFVSEGIIIHNQGKAVFVNRYALNLFGFDNTNDLIGVSVMDYILPEYHKEIQKRIAQSYIDGSIQPFYQIEVKNRRGEIIKVETRSIPILYFNQPCILVAIHLIDSQKLLQQEIIRAKAFEEANETLKNEIRQKEIAQNELIKSQLFAKNIINSSLDMIISTDHNYNITEFNKAAELTYGYKAQEVLGKKIHLLSAEDLDFVRLKKVLDKDGIFSGEIFNKRKNGELFESFLTLTPLKNEKGQSIGTLGVSRDISRIKEERSRLHLSKERYKAIFNQAFIGIARISLNGIFTQINQRFCDILGYPESEMMGKSFMDYIFDTNNKSKESFLKNLSLSNTVNYSVERKFLHKSGTLIDANVNISLVLNEYSKPAYFVVVCEDITDYKKNRDIISQQNAKLNSIIESSNYLVMSTDKEYKISTYNSNMAKWFKDIYNVKIALGMHANKEPIFTNNIYNKLWTDKIDETFKGKSQYFETVVTNKKGTKSTYEFYITPVKSPTHGIIEAAIIGFDITEKKKSEEKIIVQGAKIKSLFDNSSLQIYTVDKNYNLTSFNELFAKASYNDYGIIPYIGLNIKKVAEKALPENYYRNFLKLHKEALKGYSNQTETKVIDTKGHKIYYLMHINPVILPDSQIFEVSYMLHDITDRKFAEKKQAESLKEKEILLKEVHHRVKNNLQVISSILNLQRVFLKDSASDNLFRELQNRVRSMSFIHESLYQTNNFGSLNFGEYLRTLVLNLKHSFGTSEDKIEIFVKTDNVSLNLDYSIPCGLIVNELVSNAFKYAFPGNKKGKIEIFVKEKNNKIEIIVSDNGVGISPNIDLKNTETLGMQLVTSLVDQINGQIFHKNKEPGTEISIIFELINKI